MRRRRAEHLEDEKNDDDDDDAGCIFRPFHQQMAARFLGRLADRVASQSDSVALQPGTGDTLGHATVILSHMKDPNKYTQDPYPGTRPQERCLAIIFLILFI